MLWCYNFSSLELKSPKLSHHDNASVHKTSSSSMVYQDEDPDHLWLNELAPTDMLHNLFFQEV